MSTTTSSVSQLNSTYQALIDQLIQLDSGPLTQVEAKQSQLTITQGIMSDLGTKLSALHTALDALRGVGTLSPLLAFHVSSANSQVVTASADATAARGTHQVTVSSLAQAHVLGSSGFQQDGTDFAPGTYTFNVQVGTASAVPITVTVGTGDTNGAALANIAAAVNGLGANVSASVVTTDAGAGTKKLILQSATTGVANLISSVADAQGGLAAQLGIAGTSSAGSYAAATLQEPTDAAYTLDGISLSSSTNEVTDALSGVTINLLAKSADPVTLTLTADTDTASKVVNDFISKYNDLVTYVRNQSAVSDDGTTRQPLAGNSTFEYLLSDLRDIVSGPVAGRPAGAPSMLADLGIDVGKDGTLSVSDNSKLTAALNANPAQVVAVFGGDQGVAGRLYSVVDNFDGTNGGLTVEQQSLSDLSSTLNDRKTELQARLDARRAQLVDEFSQLQTLAYQLSQQQQLLTYLASTWTSSG